MLWNVDELKVDDFIHYIDVRPTVTLDNPPDSPYEQWVEAEVNHYWLDVEGW